MFAGYFRQYAQTQSALKRAERIVRLKMSGDKRQSFMQRSNGANSMICDQTTGIVSERNMIYQEVNQGRAGQRVRPMSAVERQQRPISALSASIKKEALNNQVRKSPKGNLHSSNSKSNICQSRDQPSSQLKQKPTNIRPASAQNPKIFSLPRSREL